MLNFNDAETQTERKGAVPAKSVVWVKLEIRPASGKRIKSNIHPLMTVSKTNSSNHYFDCEFVVKSPSFEGRKIWNNFVVEGSEKAVNISMAFFRAAIEAARGICPDDASQAATTARQVNDWNDIQGMSFPVIVGIEPSKPGDKYINNIIEKVVTPDKPEYAEVKEKGEIISDTALPEVDNTPTVTSGSPTPAAQAKDDIPEWAK